MNLITGLDIKNFRSIKKLSLANCKQFNLLIGKISSSQEEVYICEKSLYQNILITGTIGSRQNQFFNGAFT